MNGPVARANKGKLNKLLVTTTLAAAGMAVMAQPARAGTVGNLETPAGEQVVGGSASFDRPAAGQLNVNQSSQRVVINWDSFNIGANATTQFIQPNSSALAVNRVVGKGEDPAQILGTLKANGQVMVLDRNGVLFGDHSTINVGGIIASTGDVDTAAVMRGDSKLVLTNFGDGSVINNGTINIADAGLAAFVAPSVENNGVINAKLGKVALASGGTSATVDLYGDDLVEIALDQQTTKALIKNTGAINAEGGTVLMTASAAKSAVDEVINTSGIVNVSSVTQVGGKIILSGGSSGVVHVSGTLDVSGAGGGSVSVTGQNILLDPTSQILADGGLNGDGGNVSIYADSQALFYGTIFARGGLNSGNGGFVETSANDYLDAEGNVDASAANGLGGLWLLDPSNLEIITGGANTAVSGSGSSGSPFDPNNTSTNSKLGVNNINTALSGSGSGTNVYITTVGSPNKSGQDGTITIDSGANIVKTGSANASLNLNAAGSIVDNANIGTSGSNPGQLAVNFTAGNDITLNGTTSTNGGSFTATATSGDITLGGNGVNGAAGNAGGAGNDGTNAGSHDGNNGSAGGAGLAATAGGNGGNGSISTGAGNITLSADGDIDLGGNGGNGGVGGHGGTGGDGGNGNSNHNGGNGGAGGAGGVGGAGGAGGSGSLTTSTGSVTLTAGDTVRIGGGGAGSAGANGASGSGGSNGNTHGGHGGAGGIGGNAGAAGSGGTGSITTGGGTVSVSAGATTSGNHDIYVLGNVKTDSGAFSAIAGDDVRIGVDGNGNNFNATVDTSSITDPFTPGGDVTLEALGKNSDTAQVQIGALGKVVTTDNGASGAFEGNVFIAAEDLLLDTGSGLKIDAGDGGVADGTITIVRSTNGDISVGSATGGMQISQAELDAMNGGAGSAENLVIGATGASSHDLSVTISGADASAYASTTFNTRTTSSTGESVTFHGSNKFDALTVNAGDNANLDDNAIVDVAADSVFNANFDGFNVGDFNTGNNSQLNSSGHNLTINTRGVNLGVGAKVDAAGGNIVFNNTAVFDSNGTKTVVTKGTGTIDINQWAGGSIDNAVDAISNAGTGENTIHVGAGIFDETVQDVGQSNLWIKGSGQGLTIIKPTSMAGAPTLANGSPWSYQTYTPIVLAENADNVNVSGLTIDGTAIHGNDVNINGAHPTAGLTYYNAGGAASDLTLINDGAFGFYAVADDTLPGQTAHTVTATNINASGNWWAELVAIGDQLTVNVSGGNFNGTGAADGIDLSNGSQGSIENATISTGTNSSSAPERAGIGIHGAHDWTITGDTINGGGAGTVGIADYGAPYGAPAAYDIAINNTNINNVGTGVSANGGANWDINGGTYTGASGATGAGVSYVNLSGSDSTVNGLTISGFHNGIFIDPSPDTVVSNNIINNTTGDGIVIQDSINSKVLNNWVGYTADNTGAAGGTGNVNGDGIHVNASNDTTVTGNFVTQTTSTGSNIGSGIQVDGSSNVTVGGAGVLANTISHTGWDGVRIAGGGDNVQVLDNNINTVTRAGVYMDSTTHSTVEGNIISNSGHSGVNISSGSNVTVQGNHIDNTGSSYDGIVLSGVTGASVNTNLIGTNGGSGIGHDGIDVQGGSNIGVDTNTIENTHSDGVYADGVTGLTISGNWVGYAKNSTSHAGNANNIDGNGIEVDNSASANIATNHVTNTTGNGIYIDPSKNAIVVGNAINNAGENGIYSLNNNNITIGGAGADRNTITNVVQNGILVENNATGSNKNNGSTVQNNLIENAGIDGIKILNGKGALVESNVIQGGNGTFFSLTPGKAGAGHDGIEIDNNANVTVSDNTVAGGNGAILGSAGGAGAGNDGIYVTGSQSATVTGNTVKGGNSGFFGGAGGNGAGNDGIDIDNSGSLLSGFANLFSNKNGVTVTGNTVEGGLFSEGAVYDGIHVTNSGGGLFAKQQALIQDNTVIGAGHDGVYAGDTAGIRILSNTVSLTGNNGIKLEDSSLSLIQDNNVSLNGGVGIYVDPSSFVTVDGNTVTGTGSYGIRIDGGSFNTVSGNTVSWTDDDGIRVDGNTFSNVTGNTVSHTEGDGIEVNGGDHNAVGGDDKGDANTVSHTEGNGIFVTGSDHADVEANTVSDTDLNGIFVQNSDHTDIKNNSVTDAGENGIYVDPSDFVNISGNDIHDASWDGIRLDGGIFGDITDNDVFGSGKNGIEVNGNYKVDVKHNHVGWSQNNGIEVSDSDGADIDDNRVWRSGSDGIKVKGSDDADIKGNKVNHSGDNGIEVEHSRHANIDGNRVHHADGDGIRVTDSYDADIKHNHVRDVDGDGIELKDSDRSDIDGNDVSDTGDNGIYVKNSDHVDIKYNHVSDAGKNGIYVDPSDFVDIAHNDIHNASWNGIYLDGGKFGDIVDNDVFGSGRDGIKVDGDYKVDVKRNHVGWSDGNGIEVENSNGADIDDNKVWRSGRDGIKVKNSDYADVKGNKVDHSKQNGIEVEDSRHADIDWNRVEGAGRDGIKVTDSFDANIKHNDVKDVRGDGIFADNIDFGDVDDNHVSHAGKDGIDVRDSYKVDVKGNHVWHVRRNGIEVDNSNKATIDGNTVKHAGHDGIYVDPIDGTAYILNNIIAHTGWNGIETNGVEDVLIDGNHIRDAGNDGIYVNGGSIAVISNNDVTDASSNDDDVIKGNGIEISNTEDTLLFSNVITSSGANGLFVSGQNNGSVTLIGNTFNDNPVGAKFESGIIDLTGGASSFDGGVIGTIDLTDIANTFNGGEVGMLFAPFEFKNCDGDCDKPFADMSLVGNTIGTTIFNGQSEFYVQLANGAFFDPGEPTILNGLNATYDGFSPASTGGVLTQAEFDSISAKIFDFADLDTLGLFFFGAVPGDNNPDIGEQNIFRIFGSFNPPGSGLNVTITGLPNLPGGQTHFNVTTTGGLANIEPAAGGDDSNVASVEPGAGDGTSVACWGDALAALGAGKPATYSFGTGLSDALAGGCKSGAF